MTPEPSFTLLLEERAVLAVSGPDRRSFLQGLVSNDVEKVGPDRTIHAALLTAQGKYLHDFFIAEHGDALLLDAEAARLADLQRRLGLYRLRAKVALAPAAQLAVAVAFGAGVGAALGLPAAEGGSREFAGGVAFIDPRLAGLGVRLMAPREGLQGALAAAGLAAADFAVYDRLRLALGVPDGSRDLVVEKAILLESGFDELHGVDWQKGCYIGQELTVRTKYRGLVKKRLLPVRVNGELPPPGTIVTFGAEEAGEMRSGRDDVAIALLRLEAIAAAAENSAALRAGQASLTPIMPAWLRL